MNDTDKRNITDELTAIKAVVDALEGLAPSSQRHVIEYVSDAYGIVLTRPASQEETPPLERLRPTAPQPDENTVARPHAVDIRSLKEQKQPKSANEMAALTAFYLSEFVAPAEQKQSITTADIEKYFKQAGYPLPARAAMTLPNAASAGYFDSVARGEWRLNPVGYNLVAHGMPSGSGEGPARASRSRRGTTTKRAAVKKSVGAATAKKRAKKVPAKRAPTKRG